MAVAISLRLLYVRRLAIRSLSFVSVVVPQLFENAEPRFFIGAAARLRYHPSAHPTLRQKRRRRLSRKRGSRAYCHGAKYLKYGVTFKSSGRLSPRATICILPSGDRRRPTWS